MQTDNPHTLLIRISNRRCRNVLVKHPTKPLHFDKIAPVLAGGSHADTNQQGLYSGSLTEQRRQTLWPKRFSLNDAILRITETPLSVHTDITQPCTTATQHPSHTLLPASCSTVIVFTVQSIVCVEARWTMSPISVQAMIQHRYCDLSFSHFTRQDGVSE